MFSALIFSKLLIISIFLVAGFAKLVERANSRQALEDFGVPPSFSTSLSYLLPAAELTVGAALLYTPLAWWGAIGAFTLLCLFTVVVVTNLVRGRQPSCQCFGQLQSAPISSKTVIRNVLLIGVSAFVLAQGRDTVSTTSLSELLIVPSSRLLFGLVILSFILQVWLNFHLMRQNGRLLLRMDKLEAQLAKDSDKAPLRLPLGTTAPAFDLPDLAGNKHTLSSLISQERAAILVFSDPDCKSCLSIAKDIARWQNEFSDAISFAIISRGTVEANHTKAQEYGSAIMLLQKDREIAQSYFVELTPSAVLILPNGTIGSLLSVGETAIKSMVASFTQRTAPPSELAIGSAAPEFDLPDLRGQRVSLSHLRGQRLLLIFFNPHCGYCTRMVPELAALPPHGNSGHAAPLVITTGSLEDNQRLAEEGNLNCIMLLQREMEVASIYRASGTPMGYLIDEQGNIASHVAVGAQALLKLATLIDSPASMNGDAIPNVVPLNLPVQGRCQCGKANGQCTCDKQAAVAQST